MGTNRVNISGVFPSLAVVAEHVPRSETGIGALMPWADRLWFITYPASPGTGKGMGLFSIDEDMDLTLTDCNQVVTWMNGVCFIDVFRLGGNLLNPWAAALSSRSPSTSWKTTFLAWD